MKTTEATAAAKKLFERQMKNVSYSWDPDAIFQEETKWAQNIAEEVRLAEASARDEQIVELHVTVTVKVPAGCLLGDPHALDILQSRTTPHVKAGIIRELMSNHPHIAAASRRYEECENLIGRMLHWDDQEKMVCRTEYFDYDEALKLIEEREVIEVQLLGEKTGRDRTHVLPSLEKLRTSESYKI